jgi:16S rRNA (guanine(966)-N(2))-methyltransferase RsmD
MGAIGLEALSRGAAQVYFVDQSKKACRAIRENIDGLQIEQGYKILEADFKKALSALTREGIRFDIAFVDPPWERDDIYEKGLEAFSQGNLIAPDGVLVMEHSKRVNLPELIGNLQQRRTVIHGDGALTFYKAEAA